MNISRLRDRPRLRARLALVLAVSALSLGASAARAGPPFLTDDPEPTDLHHWEVYNFVSGASEDGETGTALGLDLNYGPVKDVQLSATLPFERDPGAPRRLGDIEVAAKFKLLHQSPDTASIDLTVFPRAYLPTGVDSHRVGLLLPVWAERDFGPWALFGGGGYTINPGAGNRNFWQGGLALNRQLGEGFQLGAEIYAQGPTTIGERPLTVANLGSTIHLAGPFSLALSAGKGLNRDQTVFYSALKLDL